MKVQDVVIKLKGEQFLDDREIYVYASKKNGLIGGAVGAIMGLSLLSVYEDTLYIHKALIDNDYGDMVGAFSIPDMVIKKSKSGLMGGNFVFVYEGKKYKYSLPSRTGEFAKFFAK